MPRGIFPPLWLWVLAKLRKGEMSRAADPTAPSAPLWLQPGSSLDRRFRPGGQPAQACSCRLPPRRGPGTGCLAAPSPGAAGLAPVLRAPGRWGPCPVSCSRLPLRMLQWWPLGPSAAACILVGHLKPSRMQPGLAPGGSWLGSPLPSAAYDLQDQPGCGAWT